MGFMLYKGNRFVTNRTREDLKNLKEEFEEYRQASRRAREKMTMDHFNEIKKLKEG
jgi:hypothetical protein